jgi:hypothetical protein
MTSSQRNFLFQATLYGILVWAGVLGLSFAFYLVRNSEPIFFETLITIALVSVTSLCIYLFFSKRPGVTVLKGFLVGSLWLIINIILDQLLFTFGPLQMDMLAYMKDIGLTYAIIPVITMLYAHGRSQSIIND